MQKLKILIADDDTITQALLESLLLHWGYEVIVAGDGEHARALLRAGGIHICILDWEMPRLNGRDLCWWIKAADLTPAPYVIMLTVRDKPEDVRTGYAAGADDYMTKPLDRDDLRFRLASLALKVLRHESEQVRLAHQDPVEQYRNDLHFRQIQ
jgi:sigma-B regulation protein RsbU (phosphoserine phosphatase)